MAKATIITCDLCGVKIEDDEPIWSAELSVNCTAGRHRLDDGLRDLCDKCAKKLSRSIEKLIDSEKATKNE